MTGHPQQHLPPPGLLADLRLALACLYKLPHPHQTQQHQQQHLTLSQAQEFLIYFQARNMRRKFESLIQRQKDKPVEGGQMMLPAQVSDTGKEVIGAGSSWMASIALLCQQQHHHQHGHGFAASIAERVFAAQTLIHRLIRNKLKEAIDLEMEVALDRDQFLSLMFSQLQHPLPIQPMMEHYQQCVHHYHFHPLVASVLSQYHLPAEADEDRVKGEVSLLTLTSILYATAVESYASQDTRRQAGPLMNALGSAIAALALRLRFPTTPRNGQVLSPEQQQQQQQQQSQQSPALVTMVTQALTLVFQTASASSSSSPKHLQACSDCFRACLSAIPDICIGSSGGARGRMSIGPMSLREAATELRTTGMAQLWEVLQQHFQDMQQQQDIQQDRVHENILLICERWARFLPLPLEFLQHTIPLASQHIGTADSFSAIRKAAFSYLVAIYEGGAWTAEQILAKRVGVAPEQQSNQQAGKKRQTAKSKKRQQELLNARTNDNMLEEAQVESHHRGAMACHTTVMVWEPLQAAFRAALAEADHQIQDDSEAEIEIEGEGPIGCLSACANACLPHLLRNSASPALAFPQSIELFAAISDTFQEMCRSRHRVIRAFSMEPMFSLHTALIQHLAEQERVAGGGHPLDEDLQRVLVDHFFKCSMSLATSCGYPDDYFKDMGAPSDEDLEIERNDVREVLRTVAVSERGGSTASAGVSRVPFDVTVQVLARLIHACLEAVQTAQQSNRLFPETALHCFSALAKPLNQLSKCYAKSGQPHGAVDILKLALQICRTSLQSVIEAFSLAPTPELLPLSRVVNLAMSSISPMLSNLCNVAGFSKEVDQVLRLCLNASATSVSRIPELATPSVLGNSIYDIRGAMRSPGGEDHVGCLAIMRLAVESDELAQKVVAAAGADIQQLCQLHSQLKSIETKREKGVDHGEGVTPKSRRILLNVICHLEIATKGAAGCSAMLTDLFDSAFTSIASCANTGPSSLDDENVVFQICESTWDLAAFSPVIVESLFNYEGGQASAKLACLQVLTATICRGYQRIAIDGDPSPLDFQWNRLRAAFFILLKTGASRNIPDALIDALETINRSECEAIHMQCQAGPSVASSIFHDELVSSDVVAAGLFVRIVEEFLVQRNSQNTGTIHKCIAILHKSKAVVLSTIVLPCPDPSFYPDPRPALCEAWLLVMNTLAKLAKGIQGNDGHPMKDLLVESCATAISIPFYPLLSPRRDIRGQSPFMSMEGPQTLAFNQFLTSYFYLGPAMLHGVGQQLLHRIPIDTEKASKYSTDAGVHGIAIIGAALMRAAAGGLPPWSVEFVPDVYAAFFAALNKDVNVFGQMLQMSMEVRLSESSNAAFGSVVPGALLAGPVFDGTSVTTKQNFLQESVELSKQDNLSGWRRFKVLLKKISGGKKQGTDFSQKPSPTKWEFDRL